MPVGKSIYMYDTLFIILLTLYYFQSCLQPNKRLPFLMEVLQRMAAWFYRVLRKLKYTQHQLWYNIPILEGQNMNYCLFCVSTTCTGIKILFTSIPVYGVEIWTMPTLICTVFCKKYKNHISTCMKLVQQFERTNRLITTKTLLIASFLLRVKK